MTKAQQSLGQPFVHRGGVGPIGADLVVVDSALADRLRLYRTRIPVLDDLELHHGSESSWYHWGKHTVGLFVIEMVEGMATF